MTCQNFLKLSFKAIQGTTSLFIHGNELFEKGQDGQNDLKHVGKRPEGQIQNWSTASRSGLLKKKGGGALRSSIRESERPLKLVELTFPNESDESGPRSRMSIRMIEEKEEEAAEPKSK
ncbi:hypothetical protein EmuJ_000543700 [Echinococcus multilocularis]|uniref:Uncharacterized protein n=1 Tax=Echinococcus multilocularis TaxID=6211 RepID=A0A068Y736_ECHMU|nr:hypothetical protein EmuJ_000543700 [Echinococcus multilocularis]